MKEKIKSFFIAIGYLLIAVAIQIGVTFIGGIIIGIIHVVTLTIEVGGDAAINAAGIEELSNYILSFTNYLLIISSIITILIFLLIYKSKKKNVKEELMLRKTSRINIIIAIVLGVCVWLFDTGILSIIEEAGLLSKYFNQMNEVFYHLSQGSIIVSMITVGIIAPLAEEFLFRGVIYKTLSKNISILWTIIIQAILFGVFHGNLIQGIYATFIGIILGYVTYKTKSLVPAIIMHMTNNMVPFILPNSIAVSINIYIAFIALGIIGIIGALLFMKKKNINIDEQDQFNNLMDS